MCPRIVDVTDSLLQYLFRVIVISNLYAQISDLVFVFDLTVERTDDCYKTISSVLLQFLESLF